ncbi:MAG TPA: hypothetical protein VGI66_05025 [Streptosporangiaceae bacterium]
MAIAATATLGLGAGIAGAAFADTSPGTVKAVTHASSHPDTTNVSGPGMACGSSSNGATWAFDNIARQFSVTSTAANEWTVVITDNGSFSGFADPTTCGALTSNGSIRGTITFDVQSATPPDPAGLAPQYVGDVSTTQMVNDLFDGKATSVIGGQYSYSYQNGNYVQDTSGVSGHVVGH